MFRYVFLIILSLSATPSFADKCTRYLSGVRIDLTIEAERAVNKHQVEDVADVIARADKLLSQIPITKRAITVGIKSRSEVSVHLNDKITVPYQLENTIDGKTLSKSHEETIPLIVHEYTHWVYQVAMVPGRDPLKEVEAAHLEFEKKRLAAMASGDFSHFDFAEGIALAAELVRRRELNVAFTEFFADLVAVVYAGDGKAISNGLNFPGEFSANPQETMEKFQLSAPVDNPYTYFRDFTVDRPLNDWIQSGEPHCIFGPARTVAWRIYQSAYSHQPQLFLRLVLDAIRAEFTSTAEDKNSTNVSPNEINARFIKRLTSLKTKSDR